MERFDQIFTKVCDRLAFWLCGAIALSMMLYVCANVFSRYVLRIGGVLGCYEYVGAMLVPLIYLSLSYAWYKKGYIVLDIIQIRLKGGVLWGCQFAFLLLTLAFFIAIFYGAFRGTIYSYLAAVDIGEIGLKSPKWVWQMTIPAGTFLMAIRNILDLLRMVKTGEVVPMIDR